MLYNNQELQKYIRAFILFEIGMHGVDPRETLEGTTLRRVDKDSEGYKYMVYNNCHRQIQDGPPFVERLISSISSPNNNLVDYHQGIVIRDMHEKQELGDLESALSALYTGNDDATSFGKIVDILGGNFDVLGFIFFLKDAEQYMPIRSQSFDERFKLLGVRSQLAGRCNWHTYQQYNDWIKELKDILASYLNADVTLLDAHSFLWMLPSLKEYLDSDLMAVTHKEFGKGLVIGSSEDLLYVRFGRDRKSFGKKTAFKEGYLTKIEIDKVENELNRKEEAEEPVLSDKAKDVVTVLLQLIVNRQKVVTYGDLSRLTKSKPTAFREMGQLLDVINRKCEFLGLPHISAMVINKETSLPGPGFRELCIRSFGYDNNLSIEEIFEKELEKISQCREWKKLADSIGIDMPSEQDVPLPEELLSSDVSITEGAKIKITVNAYERDPRAVKICKDHYMQIDGKLICQICGFDFGEVYGLEFANKIHIHHIKPLFEIGETYEVDPIKDLIPVCPNCHMALHANGGIGVKQLKKKLLKRKNDIGI